MDRKNKVKEAFDKSSDAVRVLLVDDDKSCLLELARMLRECGCVVTPCKGAKNALNRLRKDTGRFDIMITKRNLLDMELLQKVEREMNLLVIAMSRDGGIEAMQNNTITVHGVLKPTTMNFLITLWQCVFGKNIRNPAEVQQPTNDVLKVKRQRFKWSPDKHKIFIDCMEELKKVGIVTHPKEITVRMEAKGVEGLTPHIVKSHKQKWQIKLKGEVPQSDMQGDNDKDGPTSVHVVESPNSANQQPGAPTAMNISSQPHIGALLIMTHIGGQAFEDGTSINASTNLPANNPQNQDLDETMTDSFDVVDYRMDLSNFNEHKDGPNSVSLYSATQLPGDPAAMNISSQPHIGALQIMTQPSSSRLIRNDQLGVQAFEDGTSINASTNLPANNPQNQDLDETMPDSLDVVDYYMDLSNFNEHKDGPNSVSLNSATQLPGDPAAMNISSQPHIGAPQIMTQPSSSRLIHNDLHEGQAFEDGTSINASTNFCMDFRNEDTWPYPFDEHEDTLPDIDLKAEDYLSKDKQIP